MKKNLIAVALTLATAHAVAESPRPAPLHPADEYDIKSAAQFEAMKGHVTAGTPKHVAGKGYEVPVDVNGMKCTVLVVPYTPGSMEPPMRWKANPAKCSR